MIEAVNETNIETAARIHAESWRESHRAFCAEDFVRAHTAERQKRYLLDKMRSGTEVFLLTDGAPVGIVSLTGSLIEDLYVLPRHQNRGYGTRLLEYAVRRCPGTPTLWILDNNAGARRLYERNGFRFTGNVHRLSDTLTELEFILPTGEHS